MSLTYSNQQNNSYGIYNITKLETNVVDCTDVLPCWIDDVQKDDDWELLCSTIHI